MKFIADRNALFWNSQQKLDPEMLPLNSSNLVTYILNSIKII